MSTYSQSQKYIHHSLPSIPYSSYNPQPTRYTTLIPPYEFKTVSLSESEKDSMDKIQDVKIKIDDIKTSLHQSMNSVIERGEKLEVLEGKALDLEHKSMVFHKNTRSLKWKFCKQNIKLIGCGILFLIILIIIIIIITTQIYK